MKSFNSTVHIVIAFILISATAWMQNEISLKNEDDTKPLKELMQDLLTDMGKINEAIMYRDFDKMESAADRIAHHPKITDEERQMIARQLGSEMKTFVSFDVMVHNYADSLSKAAQQQKLRKAVTHFNVIQTNCVNCHEFSREKIRAFNDR
jgi:hypothetical protein